MIVSLPTPDGPEMTTSIGVDSPRSWWPGWRPPTSSSFARLLCVSRLVSEWHQSCLAGAQALENGLELSRKRRFGPDDVTVVGRLQFDSPTVQEQSRRSLRAPPRRSRAVERIARQ